MKLEKSEIIDVAERITKKILPTIINEILSTTAKIKGRADDELTISDLKDDYPRASLFLVRKWCKNGTLDCWTSGDSSNSKYIFRRDDFERGYYNKFKKEGDL